jgi:hypothetical protein
VLLLVTNALTLRRNKVCFQRSPNNNHNKTYYNTAYNSTAKKNPYEAAPTTAYEDVKIYTMLDNVMKN